MSPSTTIRTGLGRLPRELAVQEQEALLRLEAVGKRADARGAAVHREGGHGGREQEADRGGEADDRPPHDRGDDPPPEPALGPHRTPAEERDPQPLDPVAQEAEHGRQERQRRDHGDDADEDRARRQAAHDRVRHELEADHGQNERGAAEEHRTARRGPRRLDRVELLAPLGALLAEAAEDEERVVDTQRESHPEDHVRDEDREIEHLAEQRRQRQRHDDGENRQHEWDHAGDHGSEDEQEDDQGGRRAEEELALLQVLLRELGEVLVEGQLARHRRLDAWLVVEALHRLDHVREAVLVAPEADEHDGRAPVRRVEPLPALVGGGDDRGGAGLPQLRGKSTDALLVHRTAVEADDDDLARPLSCRLGRGREVLEEELLGTLRVRGRGHLALGGERVAEQHRHDPH